MLGALRGRVSTRLSTSLSYPRSLGGPRDRGPEHGVLNDVTLVRIQPGVPNTMGKIQFILLCYRAYRGDPEAVLTLLKYLKTAAAKLTK